MNEREKNIGWVSPKGVTQRNAWASSGYAAPTRPAGLDAATRLRQAERGRQVAANLKELGYG